MGMFTDSCLDRHQERPAKNLTVHQRVHGGRVLARASSDADEVRKAAVQDFKPRDGRTIAGGHHL